MGKQQKKQEVPETANVKSSGVSTFFVIVLFGILGVGCGVGYQHIMEQLELNNNALVAKIGSLQDEISSVKESQASISFENEIATIGQLKEDLQSTRLQINAAETELATKISSAIEEAVAAKQLADESKQAVADASIANEQKLNDKLEQIKQNIEYLLDGRKSNEAKMADLASSLNSALSAVVHKSDLDEINGEISSMKTTIEKVQSSSADQSKSLADAIKSFKGKADRLNANIKMTTNEMNGIREMVTNMVAMNEDATEAPPLEE